ncbi:hypothetical protein V502_02878 [Pseudogymnoascus sp. VKM F-4520 (FW-2644)]|nr:hypothetical protein V502_02878 [Pseudogymnoascus sp. VKM F-4520 (FW-2644)]
MEADFNPESILTVEDCVRAIFEGQDGYLTNLDHTLSAFHDLRQRSSPDGFLDHAGYVDMDTFHAKGPGFDCSGSGYLVEQIRDVGRNDLDYDSIAKQQTDVKIYNPFPPDIDMTSALNLLRDLEDAGEPGSQEGNTEFNNKSNEKADSILPQILATRTTAPTLMTFQQACQIPEQTMRDHLVTAYFKHVHPLCPVVDEFDFYVMYENALTFATRVQEPEILPLFQAIMFAAMGHISTDQLRKSTYSSVCEGQKALFDKASTLYRMQITTDHLALTKVALLLTYWSPYNTEFQIEHSFTQEPFDSGTTSSLAEPSAVVDEWYGGAAFLEIASCPLGSGDITVSRRSKTLAPWLCELSDIIKDIAFFYENNRFEREWSGVLAAGREVLISELSQVAQLESRMGEWKQNFRVWENTGSGLDLASSILPKYAMIICESVLASMYLPYLQRRTSNGYLLQRFQKVALHQIKSSASAVAVIVQQIDATTIVEDIPMPIIAWTVLPTIVYKVLSETEDRPSIARKYVDTYAAFLSFLSRLSIRFQNAKYTLQLIKEDTNVTIKGTVGPDYQSGWKEEPDLAKKEAHEAEYLSIVAKMIDLGLANKSR